MLKEILIKIETLHDFVQECSDNDSICLIDKDIILQDIRALYLAANNISFDMEFEDDLDDDFDSGGVILYDSHTTDKQVEPCVDSEFPDNGNCDDVGQADIDSDDNECEDEVEVDTLDEEDDVIEEIIHSDHDEVDETADDEIDEEVLYENKDSLEDISEEPLNEPLDAILDEPLEQESEEEILYENTESEEKVLYENTESEEVYTYPVDLVDSVADQRKGLEHNISPLLKGEIIEQLCGGDHDKYLKLIADLDNINNPDTAIFYLQDNFPQSQNCDATAQLANIIYENIN